MSSRERERTLPVEARGHRSGVTHVKNKTWQKVSCTFQSSLRESKSRMKMRRCHKNQGFQGIERDIRIRKFNARFKTTKNPPPTKHQPLKNCHAHPSRPAMYKCPCLVGTIMCLLFMLLYSIPMYADATRVFVWTC